MKALLVVESQWTAVAEPNKLTAEQKSADVDAKALAHIMLMIIDEYQKLLTCNCKTAMEAWDLLRKRHAASWHAQVVQLRRELMIIRKNLLSTVVEYFCLAGREPARQAGGSGQDEIEESDFKSICWRA